MTVAAQHWLRVGLRDDDALMVYSDYVRHLADTLELRDWTIVLDPDRPDADGALAEIRVYSTRKVAELRLCDGFRDLDLWTVRGTTVHELVHVHVEQIRDVLHESDVDEDMGANAFHVLMANTRLAVERCVDALADALAPSLPLIHWGRDTFLANATCVYKEAGFVRVHPHRDERLPKPRLSRTGVITHPGPGRTLASAQSATDGRRG